MGGDQDVYPSYLERLSTLITKNIVSKDFRIRAKYGWVARHYMDTVNMMQKVPIDSPFRIENPGLVEFIGQLPRFDVPGALD